MKTLVEAEALEYIWVADKPLLLGGSPQKVSPKDFAKKLGFHFQEGLFSSGNINLDNNQVIDNAPGITKQIEKILDQSSNDKLAICFISEKVGYGVFARESIDYGEIVAIYSGIINSPTSSTSSYDLRTVIENYNIDAEKTGGIARFFQHLPFNIEQAAEEMATVYNTPLLMKKLAQNETGQLEPKLQKFEFDKQKGIEFFNNKAEENTDMYQNIQESNSLEFHDKENKKQIAWCNLQLRISIIDGAYVFAYMTTRPIKEGEQLGFDYGMQYWLDKKYSPEIFDYTGKIFPHEKYKRSQVFIECIVKGDNTKVAIVCKVSDYADYLVLPSVIKLAEEVYPISNFELRKRFVQANALPLTYGVQKDNSFALQFKSMLTIPSLKTEVFYNNPEKNKEKYDKEAWALDLVCSIKDKKNWKALLSTIESTAIEKYCTFSEDTFEIIIHGINVHVEDMHKFIMDLSLKNKKMLMAKNLSIEATKHYSDKNYDAAANIFSDALKLCIKFCKDDEPELGTAYYNYGRACYQVGNFSKAKTLLSKSFDLREKYSDKPSDIIKTKSALEECEKKLIEQNNTVMDSKKIANNLN